MTKSIVKTDFHREITVQGGWINEGSKHIGIKNTANSTETVNALLSDENAKEIAGALLGDNAVIITDLPEAEQTPWGHRVYAGNADRHETADPAEVEQLAKNLLAIAKFIRTRNTEKEAAEEAAEKAEAERLRVAEEAKAKLTTRRDELASELRGYESHYSNSTYVLKKAIDRVIELEDAAEASKYVPF